MSGKNFSSPLDAVICAEGAAADMLHGTGELAKEAEQLLEEALAFLREYHQKKSDAPTESVAATL